MAAKSNNVWHINDIYNGIPMPNSLHLTGHQSYTTRVTQRMQEIFNTLSGPNAYDEAYAGLLNLCDEIKTIIQQFPNETAGQIANRF